MSCEQPQYRLVVRGVSQIHQTWERRRVKRYDARVDVEGCKDLEHRLMGAAIKNMLHKHNLGKRLSTRWAGCKGKDEDIQ